jgi:hypothetical protein
VICRYDRQPRIKPLFVTKPGQRLPSLCKGLLGRIGRKLVIPEPLQAQTIDPLVVQQIKILERLRIPGLAPSNQLPVPNQINLTVAKAFDVVRSLETLLPDSRPNHPHSPLPLLEELPLGGEVPPALLPDTLLKATSSSAVGPWQLVVTKNNSVSKKKMQQLLAATFYSQRPHSEES